MALGIGEGSAMQQPLGIRSPRYPGYERGKAI
jgi:hypothetical protein